MSFKLFFESSQMIDIFYKELSEYLKSVIANKKVKITGEVSQPTIRGGHLYFSLKDDSSNIKSIIWKSKNIDNFTTSFTTTTATNITKQVANRIIRFILKKRP